MQFTFLTLFPNLINFYFEDSILKNAVSKNLIKINIVNIRDYSKDKYKKVDHAQIGGGAGQVLSPDVIEHAIRDLKNPKHTIFLSPAGKPFKHNDSVRLANKSHIVLVCGRYEGFDERSIEMNADEVFCMGDFVLTGGELPALCICDSISRQIQGVLGNPNSLVGESFQSHLLEAPNFSRVMNLKKEFQNFIPPSEFSKGNHSKIADLKNNLAVSKTKYFRPDLYQKWKATKRVQNEK
ncbi:tRNA (guanosine(37)-N1)-methyltransferase TrmD [Helicobacter cappadocius]|uniref:tRNA (guanine-N(1)-)-methyltransferase n=1 Tax=Helicobacter cappadocius TaxID=3063998 RepID=A0AA90TBV4_9HELI|nr:MULTISPECIES: tRNA (guanosine(37)-N1)-methyltransferase TrmD [unclassified Helicobacter]MDO7253257.1 tRNA (guanosine(37)-N1)-methyltransferase TrmD [Helicobacter sp. faydin-H75]MDP2539181.1 tRNA (guanosine(37)-N1)-methyltransferase TrmD [Helicobacter sp. faydin-H76]